MVIYIQPFRVFFVTCRIVKLEIYCSNTQLCLLALFYSLSKIMDLE